MRTLLLALLPLFLAGCLSTRQTAPADQKLAPEFELPAHDGTTVSLAGLLTRGPAVVVFYRGYW